MKKLYKKSIYFFVTLTVFFLSFAINNKWRIETLNADTPVCSPPAQMYSNGCFTPAEVAAWITSGGDSGGGGDSSY